MSETLSCPSYLLLYLLQSSCFFVGHLFHYFKDTYVKSEKNHILVIMTPLPLNSQVTPTHCPSRTFGSSHLPGPTQTSCSRPVKHSYLPKIPKYPQQESIQRLMPFPPSTTNATREILAHHSPSISPSNPIIARSYRSRRSENNKEKQEQDAVKYPFTPPRTWVPSYKTLGRPM